MMLNRTIRKAFAAVAAAAMIFTSLLPMAASADLSAHPDQNHEFSNGACTIPGCGYVCDHISSGYRPRVSNSDVTVHEKECSYCGEVKETHKRVADYSNVYSGGTSGHIVRCKGCLALTWTESHDTNGAGGACSVCGYKADTTNACTHQRTYTRTLSDDRWHGVYCRDCEDSDGNPTLVSEHAFESSGRVGQVTDEYHWIYCRFCDLSMRFTHDTYDKNSTCKTCGGKINCTHEHTTWHISTPHAGEPDLHINYCDDCVSPAGFRVAVSDHYAEASSEKPVSNGESGHTVKCKSCTLTWTEAHDTNGAGGACSKCGYKSAASDTCQHQWEWKWSVTGAEKLMLICSICGVEKDCEHESTTVYGATLYAGKPERHDVICNVCHRSVDIHDKEPSDEKPVSNGASGHKVKCKNCTLTWTEAHNTKGAGGACSVCGYKSAASGLGGSNPETPATPSGGSSSSGGSSNSSSSGGSSNSSSSGGSSNSSSSGGLSNSSSSGGGSSSTTTTKTTTTKTASTAKDIKNSTASKITVNAAKTKVTSAMVKAFKNNKKAKTMTLDYGKNVKVTIAKSDVKSTSVTTDFSTTGKNFLSTKTIQKNKTLSKAKTVVQMNFKTQGKIKGINKVTVQNSVSEKYAGKNATIYEYKNGKLVKVKTAKVGKTGLVSFNIDHLGKYVIAVS